jgi:hypothetical protein
MASTAKKILIAVGIVGLGGFLLFAALVAFVVVGDDKAKAKATALCGPALVGLTTDAVRERARTSGSTQHEFRWQESGNKSETMLVVFPAALPLTGYMCTISAQDGIVTAAEITAVD